MFDECSTGDSKFKVACETCVKDNTVMVEREVTVAEKSGLDGKGSNCQDCEMLFHANKQSGSNSSSMQQQQHQDSNQQQPTRQVTQEERGAREQERKGERRKEQEGRGAEEAEHEQVKKDVTGWTAVTRSKKHRKRTVQIFVKVDGSKVTPMEVCLTDDKVEDVMKRIQKDEDAYVTTQARVLRRNEKLESCGVTDGCMIQVTSRMRGGGRHKDNRNKAEKKRGRGENGQEAQQVELVGVGCREMTQS